MSDEYLKKLPDKYYERIGVDRDSIQKEMAAFRNAINATKAYANKKGKCYINTKGEKTEYPSLEKDWRVENCAEIWSVRNAIMAGAKYENIAFECVENGTGKHAPACRNCKCTFGIEHSTLTHNPRLTSLGGKKNMLTKVAKQQLMKAGWYEGRKIDISDFIRKSEKKGS